MEKILLIDDEPNILNAFRRKLSATYEVHSATSGAEGLSILAKNPDLAVIVTDMQMPNMTGLELLKEIHTRAPDAMRIMLTGLADQKTVVRAINEGSVFKFLNKPCSVSELEDSINDAVAVQKLNLQERALLNQTLSGTVKLVTDIVALVDPIGAAQAIKTRKVIKELGKLTKLSASELELAPLFAGLGHINTEERNAATQLSSKLLGGIPRFEKIAKLLEAASNQSMQLHEPLRSQVILYVISGKLATAQQTDETLETLIARADKVLNKSELEFLQTALKAPLPIKPEDGFLVELRELCPGQMLLSDILDQSGKLLLKAGFMLTKATIERINTYQALAGIQTPIRVNERIPTRG